MTTILAYGFGPGLGLPDLSPFCSKLHAYLRLAGMPDVKWRVGSILRSPRGKLPYAEIDGETISDSRMIIAHLETLADEPLDAHLTEEQRALTRAIGSMLEEHLYFHLLHWRWVDEAGWAAYHGSIQRAIGRGGVPGPLTGAVAAAARWAVRRQLHQQGAGRMRRDELLAGSEEILGSLAQLIRPAPYAFGDQPSTLDASLYGMLSAVLVPDFPSPLRDQIETHPGLRDYTLRLHEEVCPSPPRTTDP